ncbi:MAG: hypothetical protein ACK4TA_07925 [Saprospiraceae bacterium]
MATRRLKLTGFARFLIVMLFLVPLAYLGAAYYNGQDGIQNIKDLLGIEKKTVQTERVVKEDKTVTTVPGEPTIETQTQPSSIDSRRLDQLEKRMNEVERENLRLRELVRQQQQRIEALER